MRKSTYLQLVNLLFLLISTELIAQVSFSGPELLCRPTNSSITIHVIPDNTIELYYEYGTETGVYTGFSETTSATAGEAHLTVISGLQADELYYYRMRYRIPEGTWNNGAEHSFRTQRATGEGFTFTITSDSHVNVMLGNASTWQSTLSNIAEDNPDFHIDLGDTYAMDNVTTASGAEQSYLYQRTESFLGSISHSYPIFQALGNHDQQEGWHLDDNGDPAGSQPVWGVNARKKCFPNPVPDGSFYMGNTDDSHAYISGDHLLEDYYAWQWGDALFIVIDPFWYTTTKPYDGNTGGGESSDDGSQDRWDWTLGADQFNWFRQTIENSTARYKFVFAHQMVGGSDDYVRGGAVPAHMFEWGGYNLDGTTYGFSTERPAAQWGSVPIHQLMVANQVSAFFHGHDHEYAYEVRDGIVYQAVPAAGFSGSFGVYNESDPYTEEVLSGPGHIRVNISTSQAIVEYIGTTGGTLNHSYSILPGNSSAVNYYLTMGVDPAGSGTTDPLTGVHSYAEDSTVSLTATPASGYEFNHWTGDVADANSASTTIAMNGEETVTAVFSETEPGSISLDGTVTSRTADDSTSMNILHTTGTGTNRLTMVGISYNSNTVARTISSVTFTYGTESTVLNLTQAILQKHSVTANYRYSSIWYLVNPPSGETGTIRVTFSDEVSAGISVGVVNFAGVDQATPLGTASGASSPSNNTTPAITLTGLNGNELVFDNVFLGGNPPASLTTDASQAKLWDGTAGNARGCASTKSATVSTTMSWTAGSASMWVIAAVPINPASSGTTYNLTMAVDPAGNGTTNPSAGTHAYGENTIVTITATPASGYEFDHWTGDVADINEATTTVTMNTDKTVTAVFSEADPFPVSIDGTVTVSKTDDVSSLNISHTTGTGTNRLMLVGVSYNSDSNPRTISSVTFSYGSVPTVLNLTEKISQKHSGNNRYSAIWYLVNPPAGETGTIGITFSDEVSAGISVGVVNFSGVDQVTPLGTASGASSPSNNTTPAITLTGLNSNELVFDNVFLGGNPPATLTSSTGQSMLWDVDTANTRGASSTRTATSSTTMSWTAGSASMWVIAAVPINPAPVTTTYELTMAVEPAGSGTTTPSTGVHSFSEGTLVNITATAAQGYEFNHWTGEVIDNLSSATTITMDGNDTVTAFFTPSEYALVTDTVGNGSVSKSPDQATYHLGDTIILNAIPQTGWTFTGWSGRLTGTVNPDTLYIQGNDTVTATFEETSPVTYTIVATAGPNGSITPEDTVTVIAGHDQSFVIEADNGYQIADVLADSVSVGKVPEYTFFNILENHTIEAIFEETEYTLVIDTIGNGSVSKSPDHATYHLGDTIILNAIPQTGWAFTGWSGGLTGTVNPDTLFIQGNDTVTAVFEETSPVTYTIIATAGPNGSITPEDMVTVIAGQDQSFTITAGDGYIISDVLVDEISVGAVSTYTFINVQTEHRIAATFAKGAPKWSAYNDCVSQSGDHSTANTTNIAVEGSGTLLKQEDGSSTGITAVFTKNGTINSTSSGDDPDAGTDAYNTFYPYADMAGVVNSTTSGWWVDLTLSGLNPLKAYTFAGTGARCSDYPTRNSTFILSGIDSSNNASTSGVTVVNDTTIAFNTGGNATQGYVVRWTGIKSGPDGTIVIRSRASTTSEISGSIANAYGLSVFMLQEEAGPAVPTIIISDESLDSFSSFTGEYSEEQSYTVSGSELNESIVITAPEDFEISTVSGSGFGSSVTIPHSGGTVVSTTIYVRFNRSSDGTSTGIITHTSNGAATRTIEVTGTSVTPVIGWSAYNDCVSTTDDHTTVNTTNITYNSSGTLLVQANGSTTGITASFTSNGTVQTTSSGDDPDQGTDAYNTFYPYADIAGVVNGTTSGWRVDLTLSGLDPSKTYTFAGTAARCTTAYTTRNSTFVLSGADSCGNSGTSGVIAVNDTTIAFNTGNNATLGYVVRWTGIKPGPDGIIVIRSRASSTSEISGSGTNAYGLSVFMLQEESTDPVITVSGTLASFKTQPGTASAAQTYTVAGRNLTEDISITAPDGFELSTDGNTYGSSLTLSQIDGAVASTVIYVRLYSATEDTLAGNIIHASSGATEVSLAVNGTVSLFAELVASEDTYMSSYNTNYNYGGVDLFKVSSASSTNRGALLKWDIGSIPTDATVTNASITLYVSTAASQVYNLYNMRRSWVEGTLTTGATSTTSANWETYDGINSWGTSGAANTESDRYNTNLWGAGSTSFSSTGSKTIELNAEGIAVIQEWINGTMDNYGLTIQNYSGSTSSNDLQISSSENDTESERPLLNISYVLSDDPYITLTGTLDDFVSLPGVTSVSQSYTVSGRNLTDNIVITAPQGFELSTDGSIFNDTLTLNHSAGTIASAIVYVRMYSTSEDTITGNIIHTSTGATSRNLAVNGIVSFNLTVSFEATADNYLSSYNTANNYGTSTTLRATNNNSNNQRASLLRWDLSSIHPNATITSADITLYVSTSSSQTYNLYNMRQSWVEGTGAGSETGDGASWLTYNGVDNWGESGAADVEVDRYNDNLWNAGTTSFSSTGSRTVSLNTNGLSVIQGWVNGTIPNNGLTIQNYTSTSGSDDLQFASSENTSYIGPSLKVSYTDGSGTYYTLNVTTVGNGSVTLNPTGGIYSENTVVTVTPEPGNGYLFSGWSGDDFADLTDNGDTTWSITMNENKNLTADFVLNYAPNQPMLIQPVDSVPGMSTSPLLQVMVSDNNSFDELDVTFYGGEADSVIEGEDFMLVVFPDPQNESQYNPEMLDSQVNWIVNHQVDSNIIFVTTVGDMVNTASSADQYTTISDAFDILDVDNVPYSVAPGNHDMSYSSPYLFNNYFGPSRFEGKEWYGGNYRGENYNNYSFFSVSGMDFILINLQYSPSTAHLNWADSLLKANSGLRAIVEEHDILNVDNSWNNQASYTALRDNSNLFIMLCGHMHASGDGAAYRQESGEDGHTIHIVLADYQENNNGNGYLRLLRFSPANDKIYMSTYSPYTGGSITTSPDQMELAYDMDGNTHAYSLIGTVNNVVNGDSASIMWPGLRYNTGYDWYATVTDGNTITTTEVWTFTTGDGPSGQPPVAVATASTQAGHAPLTVTFTGSSSSDPDGQVVGYLWQVEDTTSDNDTLIYTFDTPGTFEVILTVTDNTGLADGDTLTITVNEPLVAPVAVATAAPLSGYVPLEVAFTGSSSTDADGIIVSYQWQINEETYTDDTVIFTFNNSGVFETILIVTDDDDLTGTDTVLISVNDIPGIVVDSLALVALYNSTNGPGWTISTNWLTGSLSTWAGVTIEEGRVSELSLPQNNLSGTIPSEIGNLSELTTLNLGRNSLIGSIPNSLGNLTKLIYLVLFQNSLSGNIPDTIGNLTNLQEVYFGHNQLTGNIPVTIGNLTQLRILYAYSNQLSGNIPDEIGDLLNLQVLRLYDNQLTGGIPDAICNLANLQTLLLYDNQLSGEIPAAINNLTNLQVLGLSQNQLSGPIPASIGQLNNLVTLSLYSNHLTGTIPDELGNLTHLVEIYIADNQLTGTIPESFGNLSSIQQIHLYSNQLSGDVPVALNNCTTLTSLNISSNDFVNLPLLTSLVNLLTLNVGYNNLTFEDIEPNLGIAGTTFTYSPQDSVGEAQNISVLEGNTIEISLFVGGNSNVYQWFKDGIEISGEQNDTLIITGSLPEDEGVYICRITNTAATELTLYSRPIEISVITTPVTIVVPNGGENWQIGSVQNITWTSDLSGNVSIDYSTDNGITWVEIVSATEDDGNYAWSVLNNTSNQCIVRVSDLDDLISDISDAVFSISAVPTIHYVPVWSGNGSDHMNFYALSATLDDEDLQPGDEIGIFDDTVCVGAGIITHVLNDSIFLEIRVSRDESSTPEIDGYMPGNNATFKIWDLSEGTETTSVEINYISGNDTFNIGASTWFRINGYNTINQEISLLNGWNIFSLNITPDNEDMREIFSTLISDSILIKVQDEEGASLERIPGTVNWINMIGDWSITEGYKIRVNSPVTLSVDGIPINQSVDIPLSDGWNIISYPLTESQNSMNVLTKLINSGNLVKVQDEAGASIEQIPGEETWINNIGNFIPGEGYKVRVSASDTLTIDASGNGTSGYLKSAPFSYLPIHFIPVWEGNGLDHMNIYLLLNSENNSGLQPGDEIGIFDGTICVGSGVMRSSKENFLSLVASADDPYTGATDGFIKGNNPGFKVWRPSTNLEITLGSVDFIPAGSNVFEPMGTVSIRINTDVTGLEGEKYSITSLGMIYPNPVEQSAVIPFIIGEQSDVDIAIYTIMGKRLNTLIHSNLAPGNYEVEWNGTDDAENKVMPGIYIIKMVAADKALVRIVEVIGN